LLQQGAVALDAVEAAIRHLEGSGLFNAGAGSRLQLDGVRRMDASLMEGRELRAGAVAGIEATLHPISAARLVMDRTDHVLLVASSATRLARQFGLERLAPPTAAQRRAARAERRTTKNRSRTLRLVASLLRPRTRHRSLGLETVGAVALDARGSVAAGASTGGVALMLPGRVGDSPLIGCGVYADDEGGAVSMTGVGEGIIRLAMAKTIVDRLIRGQRPPSAAQAVLKQLVKRIDGAAGALVLDVKGRFGIRHSTPRMAAGWWTGRGAPTVVDRVR
jgi:beta-aspartyl-peptidase (threonine type)